MAQVARQNGRQVAGGSGQWNALFGEHGAGPGIPLGTAQWLSPDAAVEKFAYPGSLFPGHVWVGEAFDQQSSPPGYVDDRHVCLVSGSRGGKGVGVIVPNLCFWPGSSIVVDPKGENATVTAQRRGAGSAYTHSMGQKVCILDPFGEVQLPGFLKARYNPLDAIDPKSNFAIDNAGRVAAALIVIESRNEPYCEEAARIHVDKGYRGHNHKEKFRVWITGQLRRVTRPIRREMKRRAAVEPVIGHVKAEHRMGRNYLKGRDGDRSNAVLAAAGYNFSLLLRWLARLLRALIRVLFPPPLGARTA